VSPTIHRESGYVFYFVSYDVAAGEPPHVHVGRSTQDPVAVASQGRFRRSIVQRMVRIVEEQREYLLEKWHDYQNRI
jgi:hypothetical protein